MLSLPTFGLKCSLDSSFTRFLLKTLSFPAHNKFTLQFWKDRLFYKTIRIGIPVAMCMFAYSTLCDVYFARYENVIINLTILVLVLIVALLPGIAINSRRIGIASLVFVFAGIQILYFYHFMIGLLYLMGFTTFAFTQFSGKTRLYSIVLSIAYVIAIVLVFTTGIISFPFNIPFEQLRNNSLMFIIVNGLVASHIAMVVESLERALQNEWQLKRRITKKLKINAELSLELNLREQYYRKLFVESPSAMLIFDKHSMQILKVNNAATRKYCFPESIFLHMKISEVFPLDEYGNVMSGVPLRQYTQARDVFYVEINSDTLIVNGSVFVLLVLNDVTVLINYLDKIEEQNNALRNIAYTQSHLLRAPLANIMALSALIRECSSDTNRIELLGLLDQATAALDTKVRQIVSMC